MDTLTLPSTEDPSLLIRPQSPAVYIDGNRYRKAYVSEWEILPGPDFAKVTLAAAEPYGTEASFHLGDADCLPRMGSKVQVRTVAGSGMDDFVGFVVAHSISVNENGERFTAQCEHQLTKDLAARIASLWQMEDDVAVESSEARIRFNAGRNTLAGSSTVTVNGRTCRVFDAATDAAPWTVADALGYLLATAVPAHVQVPAPAELESLAGAIDLGRLEITGLPVADTLVKVAAIAGLELRAAQGGCGLVFHQPGKTGKSRHVRLQPPGSRLDTNLSNLCRGRIVIRRRPSHRSVLALGQRKRYETTFSLAKGWQTNLETSRWRDFVRSESNNWPSVADVYRKWVLNEHGWYGGQPWNLSIQSFEGIDSADFFLPVARKFFPCLSTDRQGQSLGVVVEIRYAPTGDWRRWRGPLWFSQDECAIYLGGDALPGEYFQAAASGDASVRVTAVVEADARLTVDIPGDPQSPRDVIDLSGRAAWRAVHSGSVFKNAEGTGPPAERDDSDLLAEFAQRQAEGASSATDAELTLGWVDTSFFVGDLIERIEGREFELASHARSKPNVRSVLHTFGDTQTTRILVRG